MTKFRFDEVKKFTTHKFSGSGGQGSANRAWIRRVASEYADLAKSLPMEYDSSCFMRVHESDMSLAQLLVIGPEGTPYARGAFVFDVLFPQGYPSGPPQVNLQTTGGGSVRFNPNLYNCGKVCLSLLGTWGGAKGEGWSATASTFLQVAVSLQSLVMVPKPYFNEPGYQGSMTDPTHIQGSDNYDRNIETQTVRWAIIEQLKNPPAGFEETVKAHFALQKDSILAQCKRWGEKNSGVQSQLAELTTLLTALPTPK